MGNKGRGSWRQRELSGDGKVQKLQDTVFRSSVYLIFIFWGLLGRKRAAARLLRGPSTSEADSFSPPP